MSLQRMNTFWGNSDYQSFLGRLLGSSFWVPRQRERENRDGGACLFSLWKKRFLLNCLLSCLSCPCMCNAAFSNTCTLPKAICCRKSFHIAHAVSVHSEKPFPLPFIPPLAGYRQESVLSRRNTSSQQPGQVCCWQTSRFLHESSPTTLLHLPAAIFSILGSWNVGYNQNLMLKSITQTCSSCKCMQPSRCVCTCVTYMHMERSSTISCVEPKLTH